MGGLQLLYKPSTILLEGKTKDVVCESGFDREEKTGKCRGTITEQPFCNSTQLHFSCPFLMFSSLRNYRDLGEMTLILCLHFCLKTFCPLIIVVGCRRFWTHLFAICQTAIFEVRSHFPQETCHASLGPTVMRPKQVVFCGWRLKF